jgi:hypothetical protein
VLNFWVLPHGPVQNRPGFAYINEVKDSTKKVRLIPFSYSTTQTYILEFGPSYIRFHTNGGTLLEAAKNITGITQPAGVITSAAHGFANGQWVYLAAIGGMTQLNGRFAVVSDAAANTFRIKDFAGNYITTGTYGAYTAGGTASRVYEIATTYAEADLFDLHYTQSADVLTIVHPTYPPREVKRLGATNWTISDISFVPTISSPSLPLATPLPVSGVDRTRYKVTSIAQEGLEESIPDSPAYVSSTAITGATRGEPGRDHVCGAWPRRGRRRVHRGRGRHDAAERYRVPRKHRAHRRHAHAQDHERRRRSTPPPTPPTRRAARCTSPTW